jgi:hypothetical protein
LCFFIIVRPFTIVVSRHTFTLYQGTVPIIRAAPGTAAEMAAVLLDDRLRQHLAGKQNLFVKTDAFGLVPAGGPVAQRPGMR